MKEKMYLLFDYIKSIHPEAGGRVFVDSAPVLDRAWARQAGLGWIGKNSMLISRNAGSFVFIGEIMLNLELEYNPIPESDFCGSCTRCIEACPTGAILADVPSTLKNASPTRPSRTGGRSPRIGREADGKGFWL